MCSVCHEVFEESVRVAARGHSYSDAYDEKCDFCGKYRTPNVMFMCGLAVKSDGLNSFGYIDETGEFVIPPMFSYAYAFNACGYARVQYRGQDAVIDTEGNFVVEPGEWGINGLFNDQGLLQITEGDKIYLVNTEYEKVYELGYDIMNWGLSDNGYSIIYEYEKDEYYIQHVSGELKRLTLPYNDYRIKEFSPNGLAPFYADYKYGYINEQGEVVVEPTYTDADWFSRSGLAVVCISNDSERLYGYINESGEIVYPIELAYAYRVGEDGLASVRLKDGKNAFMNTDGELVLVADDYHSYEALEFSSNGLCAVKKLYVGSGYIDKSGEVVIPFIYKETYSFAENGLARVVLKNSGKTAYINEKGEIVIEIDCLYASDFTDDGYAYYYVSDSSEESGQRMHVIDSDGKVIY